MNFYDKIVFIITGACVIAMMYFAISNFVKSILEEVKLWINL